MTVKKRLWINHCVAEICTSEKTSELTVIIHGTDCEERYRQIRSYLWAEGIMDEIINSELGLIV